MLNVETIKIVMSNLSTLTQTRPSVASTIDTSKGCDDYTTTEEGLQDVVSCVLKSNPLFESFGNAKVSIGIC